MVDLPAVFPDQQGSLAQKNEFKRLRYVIVQLSIYAPAAAML